MSEDGPSPAVPSPGPALGPGEEFDRIRRYLEGQGPLRGVRVGPGDDAAVLDDGTVVSTDLAIEGVHFRLDWIAPGEAGWRAVAGALSDLAAMAAEPLGVLVSLALPPRQGDDDPGAAIMAGARSAAEAVGAPLLGGDLSRSPGPVVVDVAVLGRSRAPLLRSGGRAGDELWVTGSLGGAAAAVRRWAAGREPSAGLREAFAHPRPRIAEARWLAAEGATAGIDLSDGLAGDAAHLAAAAGLRALLDEGSLPLHPELPEGPEGIELALHGGEDYELLVAAPQGTLGRGVEEFRRRFDLTLTRVGRLEEGAGVLLRPPEGGDGVPLERGGWDHFAGEG